MKRTRTLGFLLVAIGLALCAAGIHFTMRPDMFRAVAMIKCALYGCDCYYNETTPQPITDERKERRNTYSSREVKVVQSEVILTNVVETLDLNNVWGKRFSEGKKLNTSESITLLRRRLKLSLRPNTALIEVRVESEDADEAAKIANAIAINYLQWSSARYWTLLRAGVNALEQTLKIQDKDIEAASEKIELLRKALNISETNSSPQTLDQKNAERPYWDAKRELADKKDFRALLVRKIRIEEDGIPFNCSESAEIIESAIPPKRPTLSHRVPCVAMLLAGLVAIICGSVFICRE